MAGSRKKVIVRTDEKRPIAGYLPGSGVVDGRTGTLELLDTAGRIVSLEVERVRYVAYVRDFNLSDEENPERLTRKTFLARPRTEGLWLRMTFKDGEVLEGLGALDVSFLDDAAADAGLYVIPPDVRSNTQRMFVPRAALSGLQVLAVITTPTKTAVVAVQAREAELTLPFPEPSAERKS